MQPIEEWIRRNLNVEWVDSATLRYAGMDHQAPPDLGGVYRPYTPKRLDDWIDLTLIFSYLAALGTTGRILDVGTGDGWPGLPLAPYVDEVIGIDPARKRIEVAESNRAHLGHKNVTFIIASCEQIPFPDRSFAGAVAGTAIEQAPAPDVCLHEVYRVLKTGGALVATFENLEKELDGQAEEGVELFPNDDRFLYRYTVKEPIPPREAEYLLELAPNPELEHLSTMFPRRPGFARREEEPGMQPLADEIADKFGLSLLEQFRNEIVRARGFELHHFSEDTLHAALKKAGFTQVRIRGPITRIASQFFIALHEADELPQLQLHFDGICRGLAQAWEEVPAEESSVLFVQARKEP